MARSTIISRAQILTRGPLLANLKGFRPPGRANFHTALHQWALDQGVTVKLASRVVEYDPQRPSITLEDGTSTLADLIVAADGMCLHSGFQ